MREGTAGANRLDLVQDFRDAVDAAIANGESLPDFRKRFDDIVEKYGWSYDGGRNWRSRVIYETNLRSSYAAGRYEQLQALKAVRPFWQYVHADGERYPRLQHLAWNGMVLAADDPWWSTHYPPNGWGCQCTVQALNARDLKRLGKTGPDRAPPDDLQVATVGTRGPTTRTVETPAGVDPGFGYEPGRDAWFRQQAQRAAAEGAQPRPWQTADARGPADFHRPAQIPLEPLPVKLGRRLSNTAEVVQAARDAIGGYHQVFDVHGMPVAIDAATLGLHFTDLGRSPYLPLLPDLMANPFEVWAVPQQDPETGATHTVVRVLKGYATGRGKGVLLVANYQDGQLLGWTFLPTHDLRYLNQQRQGSLWWGAPQG